MSVEAHRVASSVDERVSDAFAAEVLPVVRVVVEEGREEVGSTRNLAGEESAVDLELLSAVLVELEGELGDSVVDDEEGVGVRNGGRWGLLLDEEVGKAGREGSDVDVVRQNRGGEGQRGRRAGTLASSFSFFLSLSPRTE
jgi:hypothetical protein